MRGTSQRSLEAVRAGFAPVLRAAGEGAAELGEQLFTVLDALDGSAALLRALANPARDAASKAGLVRGVLGGKADDRVVDVLVELVAQRWSADADLAQAVEDLAVGATLASAQARGTLETVENELFTLMRSLIGSPSDVRSMLSAPHVTESERIRLLETILDGRGDEATRRLARRAVGLRRGRRFVATLSWYMEIAAGMRDRLVGLATVSVPLTEAQTDRIGSLLAQAYGKPVQLNVVVDPSVVGGLRIQVGDDVVEATVLARMVDARRRMAS
ncbi:F0F1 ATP synthase subunit delta [Flavimobilis sp. GY10621]|uniref:ATP synthase subunit delta n=1 Tax=Flavimobilis rhizosphaerae TaxID=2775421 RepID=A0ABR9DMX9_9MICO|nr:F0F1 ATP synthase subunit delta [Flavimobilis rhizosphaerae]MBD9698475.1 F0F1 ATP synthase subunit delta [Flavimobilis rhizosphaerae]